MIKYLDDLEKFINENSICKEDICLVGSVVFTINGFRKNNDLDFVLNPKVFNLINKNYNFKIGLSGYRNVNENIDIYRNRYYLLGILDSNIFDEKLFFYYNGYKVILPEIECSYKIIKGRNKDLEDLKQIQKMKNLDMILIKNITEKNSLILKFKTFIINVSRVLAEPKVFFHFLKYRLSKIIMK